MKEKILGLILLIPFIIMISYELYTEPFARAFIGGLLFMLISFSGIVLLLGSPYGRINR